MLNAITSKFLTLAEIAMLTEVGIDKLKKLARQVSSKWRRMFRQTGKRGRPPLAFHLDDVVKTLVDGGHMSLAW